MFFFRPKKITNKVEKVEKSLIPKPQRKVNIPLHFQKNYVINYSQSQIEKELKKYPGLLRTLGHAYQYQITFLGENQEKQYWFCKNIEITMNLLKYFNEKKWQVDWQEKPFFIVDNPSQNFKLNKP